MMIDNYSSSHAADSQGKTNARDALQEHFTT